MDLQYDARDAEKFIQLLLDDKQTDDVSLSMQVSFDNLQKMMDIASKYKMSVNDMFKATVRYILEAGYPNTLDPELMKTIAEITSPLTELGALTNQLADLTKMYQDTLK